MKKYLTSYKSLKKHITNLLCGYIDTLDVEMRDKEITDIRQLIYK